VCGERSKKKLVSSLENMRSRSVNGFAFVAFRKITRTTTTTKAAATKKAVRKRHKIARIEMQQAPLREREATI